MLRLRAAVGGAPGLRFGVLLWREAGCFAEGNEPDGVAVVSDAVEDALEFAAIMLPYVFCCRAG